MVIVGPTGPGILVRITAHARIPFGVVGQRHVEREGLTELGCSVYGGRAILRRILCNFLIVGGFYSQVCKTQGAWLADVDLVWWLEWEVVDSI